MFSFFRLFILLSLFYFLSACSTVKSLSSSANDDDERITQAAKINTQLGIAYLQNNNITRAKQKLLLALDEAPNIPETWYSMAYYLEATGNKPEAEKYYLKALKIAPNRGDAQNNYGTFLCRSGAYQSAVERFLLAVKDPDYLDAADAYENAGLCSLKIPDNKQASQYLQQALLVDPSRTSVIIELAELDYKSGKYHAARARLTQLIAPTPQSVELSNRINVELAKQNLAKYAKLDAKKSMAPEEKTQPILLSGNNNHLENLMRNMIIANNAKPSQHKILERKIIHSQNTLKKNKLLAHKSYAMKKRMIHLSKSKSKHAYKALSLHRRFTRHKELIGKTIPS